MPIEAQTKLRTVPSGVACTAAGLICLAVLLGGLLSVHAGQDGNWDLQNYHLYTAFSLIDGRLGTDLWAAPFQVYLNPLLDLPYYAIARLWLPDSPRLAAFLAGLPYGSPVFPLLNSVFQTYGRTTFDFQAPTLPDHAAIAFIGYPLSLVAPFLKGKHLVFVGLGTPATPIMQAAIAHRLEAASSVFEVIGPALEEPGAQTLADFGWTADLPHCAAVGNPFQAGIRICPAHRAATSASP